MNIAFITIHFGYNFGSVFQTIATKMILEEVGGKPICINYIPSRYTEKRYWKDGFTGVSRILRRVLFYPVHLFSKRNYSSYLTKHCHLTKAIYAEDNFLYKCPKADIYITGSDQVWNYNHNEGLDKHYFFDGIKGKKVAFASSIGMTELPQDYADYMHQMLKEYSAISVRESSAVEMLSNWGIQSTQLIDPTLMIKKEDWSEYASRRLCPDPYLFVYLPYNVSDKDTVYKTVRAISNKNGLKVVTYSWDYRKDNMADKTYIFADPGDILSLFIHAEQVVTNSFHGTAFSINLNKQFWVYMPSHFSTRLLSIIELCGLQERMLNGVIDEDSINKRIDFSKANQILEKEREKARTFIKTALS